MAPIDTQVTLGNRYEPRFFCPVFLYYWRGKQFDIYAARTSGHRYCLHAAKRSDATATYNVNGGASLGTITNAGANALFAYTATVTKGAHTINIVPNNNGSFNIEDTAYNSTTPAIDLIQNGQYRISGGKLELGGNSVVRGGRF